MKQSHNPRRGRSRSGPRHNNSTGQPKFKDPNRAEPKLKGNSRQLIDKYKSLARDALQSGDRVSAENYFQYAEHHQRMVNERQTQHNNNANNANGEQPSTRPNGARPRPVRQNRATETEVEKPAKAVQTEVSPIPVVENGTQTAEPAPKKRARTKSAVEAKPKAPRKPRSKPAGDVSA